MISTSLNATVGKIVEPYMVWLTGYAIKVKAIVDVYVIDFKGHCCRKRVDAVVKGSIKIRVGRTLSRIGKSAVQLLSYLV